MLNQVIIVGRLISTPEIKQTESGHQRVSLTLAIQRSYKNVNGDYDNDFINCILWNSISEAAQEYLLKGDLLGIKGRLESKEVDGKMELIVIAEKVTFLSSKKGVGPTFEKEAE